MKAKQKIYNLLRWSEKYTQTDMVYLAKGGFWLTLGQIVSSASGFLLAIAFANLLPKETYGAYRYVLSMGSILAIPTLSRMNTATVRAVARGCEGSFIPALKARLKWGIFSAIAALALSGYYFLRENTTLTICFLIAAAFIPLVNSFTIYEAFWAGKKQFKIQAKYKITTQIIAVSALIITLFLTKNLFLILFAYFVPSTVLGFIFLQITLKKAGLSQKQDPETISYGKHLSLMRIFGTIADQLDKILLWYFLGAASVAIYSFARRPPQQIVKFFKTPVSLAMPKFSQQNKEVLKKSIPKKILKSFLVTIPMTIAYITFAPYVYKIIFPQYLDSVIYSQLLIVFLAPTVATQLLNVLFLAQIRKKELYIHNTVTSATRIALLFILLPIYGMWGAIFALLITRFVSLGLLLFLFKKM